jgi:hypothetical protein
MHARECRIAWTCAAWAFRGVDESKECYAVLKVGLNMLHERQREDREALVGGGDIEARRASDAESEAAG